MHHRDRHEPVWIDFLQAVEDVRPSHAGIDQHDHSPGFEQGKCERDKLQ
jgi:hypothetical protein